jgi:hypothetical protein
MEMCDRVLLFNGVFEMARLAETFNHSSCVVCVISFKHLWAVLACITIVPMLFFAIFLYLSNQDDSHVYAAPTLIEPQAKTLQHSIVRVPKCECGELMSCPSCGAGNFPPSLQQPNKKLDLDKLENQILFDK